MQSMSAFFKITKFADMQNSKEFLLDLYILWILFRKGITVPSFNIAGYVLQFLRGRVYLATSIREHSRKSPSWIRLTDCISETNNILIYNTKYLDVMMPMYNLIEYNKGGYNANITNSELFKFKSRLSNQTNNAVII